MNKINNAMCKEQKLDAIDEKSEMNGPTHKDHHYEQPKDENVNVVTISEQLKYSPLNHTQAKIFWQQQRQRQPHSLYKNNVGPPAYDAKT